MKLTKKETKNLERIVDKHTDQMVLITCADSEYVRGIQYGSKGY